MERAYNLKNLYTRKSEEHFKLFIGFQHIEDAGLICRSSHYNFGELRDSLDNRIEWSHQMGITQIILSSFWLPQGSLDDYRKACDELNGIAEKIKKGRI